MNEQVVNGWMIDSLIDLVVRLIDRPDNESATPPQSFERISPPRPLTARAASLTHKAPPLITD